MLPMYECCVDCCYSIPAGPVVEQGTELAKSAARPHPRRRPALVVVPSPPPPPIWVPPLRSRLGEGPTLCFPPLQILLGEGPNNPNQFSILQRNGTAGATKPAAPAAAQPAATTAAQPAAGATQPAAKSAPVAARRRLVIG